MRASAFALALAVLLATAAQASAAGTVTRSGSVITFRGDDGPNIVTVVGTEEEITFTDATPVSASGGCTTTGTTATCPAPGAFTVVLELEGGDDADTLTGELPGTFFLDGGAGEDRLRGKPCCGIVTMSGGPDTDTYEAGDESALYIDYSHLAAGDAISIDGQPNDPEEETVPAEATGVVGGAGNDELTGTSRNDYLGGGPGDDELRSGDGADTVEGGDGADVLDAGAGNDLLRGGSGDDDEDAGPGEDILNGGPGADTQRGGDGIDRATFGVLDPDTLAAADAAASLNDVRDDGRPGERDDIRADVEDLSAVGGTPPAGRATIRGDGDFNILTGSTGGDTITGGGGGDILRGLAGDDTLDARDGAGSRVECGLGTDSARVDAADTVEGCETVDRAPPPAPAAVAGPSEDRPPTVAFAAPLDGALLGPATTVRVDAADDRSVGRVVLLRDGRVVGTDVAAPYEFPLALTAGDVGRSTLVAVAVDSGEQSATAVRAVQVDRFAPALTARLARSRDRTAPYRFRLTGTVRRPAGLTAERACSGVVAVQVKRGSRTVSTRRVRLSRACTYSSTVTFRDRRRLGSGRLRFTARFAGNAVLAPATAPAIAGRSG